MQSSQLCKETYLKLVDPKLHDHEQCRLESLGGLDKLGSLCPAFPRRIYSEGPLHLLRCPEKKKFCIITIMQIRFGIDNRQVFSSFPL